MKRRNPTIEKFNTKAPFRTFLIAKLIRFTPNRLKYKEQGIEFSEEIFYWKIRKFFE